MIRATDSWLKHPDAISALALLDSHQRVFIQGAVATPLRLIEGLVNHAARLKGVEITHLHTEGKAPYADPTYASSFNVASFFVASNMRERLDCERVDYIPVFLSEIPQLFRSGRRSIDIALIHVSPPDTHGYCTLGTSVDATRAAVETAKVIVAQVNPHMPRVHGDGFVHASQIHHYIEVDDPLPEIPRASLTPEIRAIGRHVAELIEDGSALQMGIGAVPDAVLEQLHDHRHLGIHSEMWSDGALDLILSGAVDNSRKAVYPGRSLSTFLMGSQRLYDFVDDNPSVVQTDVSYVNDPHVIARNPKVVAINSALEVDLTGQVCADSIGCRIYSGVGGQMDFIRGASQSKGGKPIIALPSRTRSGDTRIVSQLKAGAGVVTTRAHVHFVVTEYGVADLYGKTLRERSQALIRIAHPDDRERLEKEWHVRFRKT